MTHSMPDGWTGGLYANESYGIVRINGQLTWATDEKMKEYHERFKALGGDWSWEQEVELDTLLAQRIRQVFHESNERVEAKRQELAFQESIATYMVMTHAAELGANLDGSFNPSRPTGLITFVSYEKLHKLRKRRRAALFCLSFLAVCAFSNVFTMPHAAAWLQYLMLGTWLPAVAVTVYNLYRTNFQINSEEIRSTITFTPLPAAQMSALPPKPRSERYADKFVETGQLMYKYLMEDAYREEHEHDWDIEEY